MARGKPPNFWSGIIKYNQIPTMWQSFRAIVKETVAKKRKKDASRVKHNRPELIVPGGLKTTAVKHKVLEDLKSTYANSRRLYGWSPLILAFSLITYTPHGRIRYVTLRWAHFWLLFVHGNVRRHSATVSCLLLFTSALVLRCRQ